MSTPNPPNGLVCRRCGLRIDPSLRCGATWAGGICMANQGHEGWHWTEMGGPGLRIWTGVHGKNSCSANLGLDQWCQKPPGHEGPHNDSHGMSWGDQEATT